MNLSEITVALICAFAAGVLVTLTTEDVRHPVPTFIPVPPMRSEMAPIRPRKCLAWMATQADGGKWKLQYCKKGTKA